MKKLFVSDLDGTLLKIGNDYSAGVSEENKNIREKSESIYSRLYFDIFDYFDALLA